jgi:PilZ domain
VTDKVLVALREPCANQPNRYPVERRGQKRLLCSELVQIYWTGPQGTRHEEIVVLENLSSGGLGLFTGVALQEGTNVRVLVNQRELSAKVRHCVFQGNGHLVGLALDAGSKWTKGNDLAPEHLLDVSMLDLGK